MRIFSAILAFMLPLAVSAGITSHDPGSKSCGSLPFGNWNVAVDHQFIRVRIDDDLFRARFHIEYRVRTDTAGIFIPFMFEGTDVFDDFTVTVNGAPAELLRVSDGQRRSPESLKKNFPDNIFGTAVQRYEDADDPDPFSSLAFLRMPLAKGEHTIRVDYTAFPYVVLNRWTKKVEYRFDLSNARFWPSFGTLEVEVDLEGCDCYAELNIGDVNVIRDGNIYHWSFGSFPDEELIIRPVPKMTHMTYFLMTTKPESLGFFVAAVLMVLHLIYLVRKRIPANMKLSVSDKWVLGLLVVFILFNYYIFLLGLVLSLVMLGYLIWCRYYVGRWPVKMPHHVWGMLAAGVIVIPYIDLRVIYRYYDRIDAIIGQNASGYHGYILHNPWLYPIYVFEYLILILFIFNWLKLKYLMAAPEVKVPRLV